MRFAILLTALTLTAHAQWTLQNSGSTASLRGIHALSPQMAWASGTGGTVLRTEDGGHTWQHCTTPPNAEKLDFRGVQGIDAATAIVMSSGKGDLSRLYKTTDGCKTWTLLYTNPDQDGFWDGIAFTSPEHGFLLGDPVLTKGDSKPHIFLEETSDGGSHWKNWHESSDTLTEPTNATIFAASNSSMLVTQNSVLIGLSDHVRGITLLAACCHLKMFGVEPLPSKAISTVLGTLPFVAGESAGIYSIAAGDGGMMAVGGDYQKPNDTYENAVFVDGKDIRHQPQTFPHGYRSAVAYDPGANTWVTVGPNGTDISTNDGRNWQALKPGPNDPADADQHWNALSLPFVVGSKGRIGLLQADRLKPPPSSH